MMFVNLENHMKITGIRHFHVIKYAFLQENIAEMLCKKL